MLIFLVAGLEIFPGFFQAALHDLNVGQDQLQLQGLCVGAGVCGIGEEGGVVKAADHVDQSVHLTDVLQNRISAARPLAHACHVHEVDAGGGVLLGLIVFGQPVQPLVGHFGLTDVGLGGGAHVAAGLRL